MDNFEKMENQGSYTERITEIASRLAINKYNANKGKNVDTIGYNEQDIESIVVKGQELEIIETSYNWIEFKKD